MPRNRLNKAENAQGVESVSDSVKSSEKPIEKPKVPARKIPALILYRQLYSLRETLRLIDPKIAKTTDKLLASIGYPAKLISFLFQIAKLSKLSSAISDYRTFSRVVSTPATIEYTLDLLLDNKNPDRIDRYVEYLQAICGLGYQVFEDLAYLASKNVISLSAKRQADYWIISDVFWAVDILAEIGKYPYHRYVLHKPTSVRKLAVNLAWLPLTYHWATYDGVFNDGVVGLLGTMACWPNMVFQWKSA